MNEQQRDAIDKVICDLSLVWPEHESIPALRQLLERPAVQEPVAEYRGLTRGGHYILKPMGGLLKIGMLLYTTTQPAQPAAWVGLTNEDYPDADNPYLCLNSDFIEGARWADATLRLKNGITASAKAVSK